MNDKTREEFEAAFVAEYVADLASKAKFDDGVAETIIRATALERDAAGEYTAVVPRERFKGWVQGRASVVVELPIAFRDCDSRDAVDVREAVEAAGGTVKA